MNYNRLFLISLLSLTLRSNFSMDYNQELLKACQSGNLSKAQELIVEYNANVNTKDDCGYTPLHIAVWRGLIEVVKLLLNNRADINAQNNAGWTPLHDAAYKSNAEIARLLIDNKANVNARTNFMETPLHWAVQSPYTSKASINMTRTLLNAQADVNAQDDMKYTPLRGCAIWGYIGEEHAKMLSEYIRLETEVHNNPTQETVTNSIKNGFTHPVSVLLGNYRVRPTKQHIELAKELWQTTNDPIYKAMGRILLSYYGLIHQIGVCHPEAYLPEEILDLITHFVSTSNTEENRN
jgi:Ankyrin repeats (3 copies)/Ankyrin repeat